METFLEFSTNKYKITGYIGKNKYVIEVKSTSDLARDEYEAKTMASVTVNVKA